MKKILPLVILLIVTIPAVSSLFNPGFFESDDGEWMIIRFSAFHQALADGQFPVRFLSRLNHEYGYPVANFLYPGFMYLAEIPKLLGFGFINSVKIILGFSMMLSAVFTYLWLSHRFEKLASFTGAFAYLYMPYHLFDLYKRGSVGEILALAVVPFALWQVEKKSITFTSVAIGFLILSHNTLAFLFLPMLLAYMIFRKLSYHKYTSILAIGLGISAFFWIPALLDLQYTKFFQTQVSYFQDHFASFELVGVGSIVVMLTALLIAWKKREREMALFFLVLGLVGLFFSFSMSTPFWIMLPVSFVQFPFRFLSLLIVAVSFLTAYVIAYIKGQFTIVSAVLILALFFTSGIPFLKPARFFDIQDSYYATNEATTTVQNEYMPKWVKTIPVARPEKQIEVSGETMDLKITPNHIAFKATVIKQAELRVHKIFFPGWKLYVDGVLSPIFYDNDKGIMTFPAYPGTHAYDVKFTQSTTSVLANTISLVSLGFLLILAVKKKNPYGET